jgi:hypothetical protein
MKMNENLMKNILSLCIVLISLNFLTLQRIDAFPGNFASFEVPENFKLINPLMAVSQVLSSAAKRISEL